MLNSIIKYFLENKLVTAIVLIAIISWGIVTSPFAWNTGFLPKDPVPVDAIPDIGENQQIEMGNLAPGTYLLKIITSDRKIVFKKVMKK